MGDGLLNIVGFVTLQPVGVKAAQHIVAFGPIERLLLWIEYFQRLVTERQALLYIISPIAVVATPASVICAWACCSRVSGWA